MSSSFPAAAALLGSNHAAWNPVQNRSRHPRPIAQSRASRARQAERPRVLVVTILNRSVTRHTAAAGREKAALAMASGDLVQRARHCRRRRQQSPTLMDGQTRAFPAHHGRTNRATPPDDRASAFTPRPSWPGRDPAISRGTVLDATPGPMLCVPRFNATQYRVSN